MLRKSNTDAIAVMALDNYLEMRERVADPSFSCSRRYRWNSSDGSRSISSRVTQW